VGDISLLLEQAKAEDAGADQALFSRFYAEPCRIARHKLARESTLIRIDACSLVQETCLRLTHSVQLPATTARLLASSSEKRRTSFHAG
jgi:DNA-directed RNA polymerase specialized sigma24 family protein